MVFYFKAPNWIMTSLSYFLIFIIACFLLVRSGSWIVKSLTRIAQFLKWREFIVASVLMAFATSLPEIFICITSSIHKRQEISLGDVVGSNIIAITFVIGIGSIISKELKLEGKIIGKLPFYVAIISILPFLLILDKEASRIDGIILISALIYYFYYLLSWQVKFKKVFNNYFKRDKKSFLIFLKDLATFFMGVIVLILGAEGIVFSSSGLADELNLPLGIVGIIIVAIGTSLPEITFGIKSITMKHKEMIFGDILGSVVINSTLVLGILFIISPFKIDDLSFYLRGAFFTIIAFLFFIIFLKTSKSISKKEGFFLILLYFIFIFSQILNIKT